MSIDKIILYTPREWGRSDTGKRREEEELHYIMH
jgi:hypothetical protein